jgi:hypothetical protein
MSQNGGPLRSANQEIRDAIDTFVAKQRSGRYLPSLVDRTDAMLTELETFNLSNVRRTPASWRSELASLVADLPFGYERRLGAHASPTAAIDVVFEIQERLFRSLTSTEPKDELPDMAS